MDLINRWMWVVDDFCGGVNFAEYFFVLKCAKYCKTFEGGWLTISAVV